VNLTASFTAPFAPVFIAALAAVLASACTIARTIVRTRPRTIVCAIIGTAAIAQAATAMQLRHRTDAVAAVFFVGLFFVLLGFVIQRPLVREVTDTRSSAT
jgi:hypothetical protein